MTASTRRALLVASPAIVLVVMWAGVLAVTAATGRHPIWNLEPRNIPEAVAFRDGAAVIRRVGAGEDVNRPEEVRARIILPETATLTPIEAAALSGQTEMVHLLLDLGASPEPAAWQRAFCETDENSIRDLLAAHRPPGASDACASR